VTKFEELVLQGTRAAQPSAGIAGRLYYVTDEEKFEYDNGSSWGEWKAGLGITWAESTTTDGETQNRSTSGSFLRLSGVIWTFRPLKVTEVKWDVRIADTYDLYLGSDAGDNVEYMITEGKVVSSPGAISFTPDDGEFILHHGMHLFCLEASGSVLWWDCNSTDRINGLYYTNMCYYNATSYSAYCIPLGLTAYEGTYNG